MTMRHRLCAGIALVLAAAPWAGCHPPLRIASRSLGALTAGAVSKQDTSPKEELRLLPQEAYLRHYLQLFGVTTPIEAQKLARARDGGQLFDSWGEYLSALGFPDYRLDLPRAAQTNGLMVASFERLGEALCDRAVERDLKAAPPLPSRQLFTFEIGPTPLTAPAFAERFDLLHQTFLSYPAALAPNGRINAFFQLYQATVARHQKKDAPRSRFTPEEAGWAAVCYGLVRHPEHHLY
jgi:hypothetical protein